MQINSWFFTPVLIRFSCYPPVLNCCSRFSSKKCLRLTHAYPTKKVEAKYVFILSFYWQLLLFTHFLLVLFITPYTFSFVFFSFSLICPLIAKVFIIIKKFAILIQLIEIFFAYFLYDCTMHSTPRETMINGRLVTIVSHWYQHVQTTSSSAAEASTLWAKAKHSTVTPSAASAATRSGKISGRSHRLIHHHIHVLHSSMLTNGGSENVFDAAASKRRETSLATSRSMFN